MIAACLRYVKHVKAEIQLGPHGLFRALLICPSHTTGLLGSVI